MQSKHDHLDWRDGQPVSRIFGDVYFSRDSGIEETRYVFLQQNRLRERWQHLAEDNFTIGETGFGSGLNFLCAWQLWCDSAPAHARLHFVSTERHPLTHEELAQTLALWPELASYSGELLTQYRQLAPGWRRMVFEQGRVLLTLLIGDVRETLPQLCAQVDAWFLDGFSPAKNPEMWQPELLKEIGRLSAPGCTLATYTCAGEVKRGLAAAGFRVEKIPGFGSKRAMLRAEMATGPASKVAEHAKSAIVIGGGIAGTATAYSLAQRGWQVTLMERHAGLASEASGNPQGILYPRLSGHDIPLGRLALAGYLYTLSLLRQRLPKGQDWDDCGLLQLACNAREIKRHHEIMARALPQDIVCSVTATEAGTRAGIEISHDGLWFPHGGWVHPPALCRALAEQPGIRIMASTAALTLARFEHGWQVWGKECLAEAAIVVVCSANDSLNFSQSAHLPLQAVRGQITLLPATSASARLRSVLCTEGYVSPARGGQHCLGATFAPDKRDLETDLADHAENIAMLQQLSPALYQMLGAEKLDISQLQGRAALRCASPDYLPLVGMLLDAVQMSRHKPGSRLDTTSLPWHEGLYINTGHGSKGLISAPLCGEIIAAALNHEPLPVDAGLLRALDPNRFMLRAAGLKRWIGSAIG